MIRIGSDTDIGMNRNTNTNTKIPEIEEKM